MYSPAILPQRRAHRKSDGTLELLLQERILWRLFDTMQDVVVGSEFEAEVEVSATQGNILVIPFLFRLPAHSATTPATTTWLPPSFSLKTALKSKSVRHYLRVEGQRKHWYLRPVVKSCTFPVVPVEEAETQVLP